MSEQTKTSIRGFQYTRYRETQGASQETIAYTATIVRDGREVGKVFNAGGGGADMQTWADREDREAFQNAARAEYPDATDGFHAVELLSGALAGMAEMTAFLRRKRSWVVFVPSDGYVASLRYGKPDRTVSLHRLAASEPDAQVFDRNTETFVPLSAFLRGEES